MFEETPGQRSGIWVVYQVVQQGSGSYVVVVITQRVLCGFDSASYFLIALLVQHLMQTCKL